MDCLHPHLLSTNQLIQILIDRQLKIQDVDKLSHAQVLEIFYKFAVPMGRREKEASTNSLCNDAEDLHISKQRNHKRVLPPPVNECVAKLSRVTLNVNSNGGAPQKRSIEEISTEKTMQTSESKRKKITWP